MLEAASPKWDVVAVSGMRLLDALGGLASSGMMVSNDGASVGDDVDGCGLLCDRAIWLASLAASADVRASPGDDIELRERR